MQQLQNYFLLNNNNSVISPDDCGESRHSNACITAPSDGNSVSKLAASAPNSSADNGHSSRDSSSAKRQETNFKTLYEFNSRDLFTY